MTSYVWFACFMTAGIVLSIRGDIYLGASLVAAAVGIFIFGGTHGSESHK